MTERICKCGHSSEEHRFQPCDSEHPCRHFDEKTMKTCEEELKAKEARTKA